MRFQSFFGTKSVTDAQWKMGYTYPLLILYRAGDMKCSVGRNLIPLPHRQFRDLNSCPDRQKRLPILLPQELQEVEILPTRSPQMSTLIKHSWLSIIRTKSPNQETAQITTINHSAYNIASFSNVARSWGSTTSRLRRSLYRAHSLGSTTFL
jgi:hypothetical protein